ncbi:hypothetical protein B566_EDAN015671, partial [Ephemera danica]
MSKNPLRECSVRSADLEDIKETYRPNEYSVSPTFIKMRTCGVMCRDHNIYAGKCLSRGTCQPQGIRMET